MDSDLSLKLSELEHRYAEALTAGKDVKTLSRIWEKIKQLRAMLEQSYSRSDNSVSPSSSSSHASQN